MFPIHLQNAYNQIQSHNYLLNKFNSHPPIYILQSTHYKFMHDSQIEDYLEITESLLASRREWEHVPEIVCLTIKAAAHLLAQHNESFAEHKTLINEQSLKIKQLELRLGSKMSKKEVEIEMASLLKNIRPKLQQDSLSEYDRLAHESRYQRERTDPISIEELKTIAEIISDKKIIQIKNESQVKLASLKAEIDSKITNLREELKNKFLSEELERREIKNWASECRQIQGKIEQSHNASLNSFNEEKINSVEQSQKRINENLNHIIAHLENNYVTKQQLPILIEKDKKNESKSPHKQKAKTVKQEESKLGKSDSDIEKTVHFLIDKNRQKQRKQWSDFKQSMLKEMGLMVKVEIVNNLIDSFQKDLLEKYQTLSNQTNKLEIKMAQLARNQDNTLKDTQTKSEKRPEKKTSPIKSIQSIQHSLVRLERTIIEKQTSELNKLSDDMDNRNKKNDVRWIAELDRRQKHLCEVIEQTYNQSLRPQHQLKGDNSEVSSSLKKLFQTNLFSRYLYIGTKECKKDTCITWEKQVLNNLVQNFIWKKDSTAVLVSSPGLYRVETALYGQIQSQFHILVNGDPVGSIKKNEPSKVTGVKIRGSYFQQVMLLPSKAKISLRANQHFYGQAFLQLQQL